jgi:hypothetical protein
VVTGERPAELPLRHANRMWRLPTAVQDAGDEALAAQASRFARAGPLAFLDLESHSLGSHSGPV